MKSILRNSFSTVTLFTVLCALGTPSFAETHFVRRKLSRAAPSTTCLDHGHPLEVINGQVLQWKLETANGFTARAHIAGVVDEVFSDHSGHRHFSLRIGEAPSDHIEVIYNLSFGALPIPQPGDKVEACGDYITSIAQSGPYPPSPDGAILHWVHQSPSGHEPGYVVLNGIRY